MVKPHPIVLLECEWDNLTHVATLGPSQESAQYRGRLADWW